MLKPKQQTSAIDILAANNSTSTLSSFLPQVALNTSLPDVSPSVYFKESIDRADLAAFTTAFSGSLVIKGLRK